jgi:hypothetical protein
MKGAGSSTSTEDPPLLNDLFRVFPNPSSGEVTLLPSDSAPDDFTVDVISPAGTLVRRLGHTERPDLSMLPAGNYMLLIRTREGRPLSLLRIIIVK